MFADASIEGGNPGGHAVGAWIVKSHRSDISEESGSSYMRGTIDLGTGRHLTNNIAEYSAIEDGLAKILSRLEHDTDGPDEIVVKSDSNLAVNQLNNNWSCNVPHLIEIRDRIWNLCEKFECPVIFEWIPRFRNKQADELSRSLY